MYPQIAGVPNYVVKYDDGDNWKVFAGVLQKFRGVTTGVNSRHVGHAVAFQAGRFYDPNGYCYSLNEHVKHNFFPQCAWCIRNPNDPEHA